MEMKQALDKMKKGDLPTDTMTPLERDLYNYNTAQGDLKDGIDCPICFNKGYIGYIEDGYLMTKPCKCLHKRNTKKVLERSGLLKLVGRYTFDNFNVSHQDGKLIIKYAKQFILHDFKHKWFFIGGQVGVGKTHICTAIMFQIMELEYPALYALWRDLVSECKAQFNGGDVDEVLEKYQVIPYLYLDDFLKGENPTPTELDFAYKIINYRYNNNLTTVISSERMLREILALDEAIGSRIAEMAGVYAIDISKDGAKNYRMNK